MIPYSPLAGGFLTGKYRPGQPIPAGSRGETNERIRRYIESPAGQKALAALEAIGRAHGKTIAQTALAWLLSNPVITAPIIGANTVSQLQELLGAADYRLSAEEMHTLNETTAWQ